MRDLQEAPDREWDEKLGIITAGAGADSKDTVNFRYEPTPYAVLDRLAESGLIGPHSVLIDYGQAGGGRHRSSACKNRSRGRSELTTIPCWSARRKPIWNR